MNDNLKEKLTVCIEKGGQRDQAEAFANRYSVTIEEEPGEELTLLFDAKGISLTGYGLTYQGDFEGMVIESVMGDYSMKCWFVLPKVQRRKRLQLMQQQEWERILFCLRRVGMRSQCMNRIRSLLFY